MRQAVEVREGAPCSFPPGLQLVYVKTIRKARTANGEIRADAEGNLLLEVVFENEAGQQGSIFAYANGKSQWIFDKLCNALKISTYLKGRTSTKEIIGKWLYVVCAAYIKVVDGVVDDKPYKVIVKPNFYIYMPGAPKPKLIGDPSIGASLGGEFLVHEIYQSKAETHERAFGDP